MLSVKPELPVDPTIVAVLRTVHEAAAALGITYLLVGATARDILLIHVFGLRPGRATRDVDFALAIADWETFTEIKTRLQSTGQFVADEKSMHRLHCGDASVAFVDLIPFGGIANTKGMIMWPPDMMIMMNVAGFDDALQAAMQVQIEKDLVVNVASFAGLSLLKLFAWKDRRAESPKDAIDFVNLLRSYEQIGNQERIYSETLLPVLEKSNYDPELTGAWLLGRDAAEIAMEPTYAAITDMLQDEVILDALITDMARALGGRDDSASYATILLGQYKEGFLSFSLHA